MPRHPRLLLGVLLAISAAGLLLALAIAVVRTPAYPRLPNPNGYDDFVRGGRAVMGEVSSYPDMDAEALRNLITANAEPLRLIRLGLTKRCSFPTELGITNFSATVSDLSNLKKLAQLLRAEGRLGEMEDRPADAAEDYVQALRLGNELSRGGFLIQRLVGIACEAIGGIALAKLVHGLNCEQARRLIGELEKLDETRVTFAEVRQLEKKFGFHELLKEENPLHWISGWWEARGMLDHGEARHRNVVAHERLIMTELALVCYKCDDGIAPARLDQLVPNYLSRVPRDPFNDQPLHYQVKGTNWTAYSVGPDGVDDAGKPSGRGLGAKGDLLYDSAW